VAKEWIGVVELIEGIKALLVVGLEHATSSIIFERQLRTAQI
jgi:hypothetical protein